jgi:uncharacterized hydrophobic protein (TIGR00271 family)
MVVRILRKRVTRFMSVYAVVDSELTPKELPVVSEQIYCVVDLAHSTIEIPEQAEVIVCLSDVQLRAFLEKAHAHKWVLTLVKHKSNLHGQRGLCITQLASKPIDMIQTRCVAMDIVFGNNSPVLNKIVVGKAFSFQPGGHSSNPWLRLKTVWHQVRHLKEYQLQRFKFSTPSSPKEVETAAVGVVATNHVLQSNLSKQLLPDGLVNDTMFYSLLVAPKSLFEMLQFLFIEPFSRNVTQPGFLSVLRSKTFSLTSPQAMSIRHDDLVYERNELELVCKSEYVKIRVPNSSLLVDMTERKKEIRRLQNLPTAEESIQALAAKPLPWITHAATEDFRDLYQQLRENAQVSSAFLIFMVLSALLASFGLYADSAPVIIGAMILAPLMAPIVSLAMAFARQDSPLLISSSQTLLIGFLLAVGCSMLLSLCLPLQIETSEITARLRPTLLDLGIAIISGIAAAYAHARSEAAKSLAGVAIAVALVPPLSVVGIGLGWFSLKVAGGALLLFVTNLAGIILAASATFLLLGFAPFSRARKGMVAALIAVAIVSVPLAFSFSQLTKEAAIVSVIEHVESKGLEIRNVRVLSTKPKVRIRFELVSNGLFDGTKVRSLKESIEDVLDTETELEVNWITRY